jgi:mannose-6-phosphate isomerase-like protein (cupin superfamily)
MKAQRSLLERSLGSTIHKLRTTRQQSLQELAAAAKVSLSMISRIENGRASPSLATVNALANALGVPVAYLLSDSRRQTDVSFVKSGGGLTVDRRGGGTGHQYQLLGHSPRGQVLLEPYLISLSDKSEDFSMVVHEGVEFFYVLSGSFVYRVADRMYDMSPGDSLCFDSGVPHGPERLITTPVKLLAVIGSTHN